MNVTKIVQCSICLAMLCGTMGAAPGHWRENVVYQTTAGKAEPAVLLGVTAAVAPAPLTAQTQLAPPAPATPLSVPTATPALNKGTVSALQSARSATVTATPLVTTTAATPGPATRVASTPIVTTAPRELSTTSKAAGAARTTRGSLRRTGSVDQFVDRNNDGYDDRTSALDL